MKTWSYLSGKVQLFYIKSCTVSSQKGLTMVLFLYNIPIAAFWAPPQPGPVRLLAWKWIWPELLAKEIAFVEYMLYVRH